MLSRSSREETNEPVKVFFSYAFKDEKLKAQLETSLSFLKRDHRLITWHGRNIAAGDDWKKRIDENLNAANIILLLISPDFAASDYCWSVEMKRALERHE